MRLGFLAAICIALVTLGGGFPADAQMVREHDATTLRSFHGGPSRIKRSFKSDSEARAVLSQILAASGLAGMEDRILIRASAETPNAEASIEKDERLIFYNALFMQGIAAKTGDYWSMVAILAHEVGHHVRLHTVIDGRAHEFELEADYHAGFVIRRMGGTLDQALGPFRTFPESDTPTHPGRAQRLQAVTLGWTDAGATQAPGWAKPQQLPPPPQQPGPAMAAQASMAALDAKPVPPSGTKPVPSPGRCTAPEIEIAVASGKQCIAPGSGVTIRDCADCPEMVVVPAGSFTMGSNESDVEKPPHKVTIAKPFAVGKFEVTFAEWDACVAGGGCTHKPGDEGWGHNGRPVLNVSWDDVTKQFLPWLSRKTGQTYRLLTEAEWEYAARASTTTKYFWGDDIDCSKASYDGGEKSNCFYNPGGKFRGTKPVGSFNSNAWGLHDMHGNVWEWVEDCWHASYKAAPADGTSWSKACSDDSRRVVRGGSWVNYPQFLRSAFRNRYAADNRDLYLGFRVGRTLSP